jgi:cold shock CspA family protein
MNQVFVGVTKWFGSKGEAYGYIHRFLHADGKDGEIFVHFKQLLEEGQENPKFKVLKKGQKVSFEIGPGFPAGKGTQAYKVRVLDGNDGQRHGGTQAVLP